MAGERSSSKPQRVRTISSLTQEQAQRKRDSDRKAQRALRQRTNSRIQALEEQLAVLKAERIQENNTSTTKIKALRKDNEDLRRHLRRMGAVVADGIVQDTNDNDSDKDGMTYQRTGDYHASVSSSVEPPLLTTEGPTNHDLADPDDPNFQESRPYISEDEIHYSLQDVGHKSCEAMAELSTPRESWSFSKHPVVASENGS
jgi:hypothetical protein